MNTIEVEISHGKIRGIREKGVNIFKGIPYAGSVSGDRRFRRPADLKPWTGVRDALQLGAPAIQPPRQNEPEPAEDCLFLNVWTPANDHQKRPVMFYNHGGGFVIGSGGTARSRMAQIWRAILMLWWCKPTIALACWVFSFSMIWLDQSMRDPGTRAFWISPLR